MNDRIGVGLDPSGESSIPQKQEAAAESGLYSVVRDVVESMAQAIVDSTWLGQGVAAFLQILVC